jgi:hypothetical protein
MFEPFASAVIAFAKAVQSVVQLFSGIKTMLTISTGETQRPLKLRDGIDRRVQPDRRKSSVDMRLRVGLWYQYHRATRAGEFDQLPRDSYRRARLQEDLLPEMHRYEFHHRDNGSPVTPSYALNSAIDFLWSHPELGCNAGGDPTAVYTMNAISEYLVRTFNVSVLDRRKTERRTVSASSAS